MYDVVVVGAGPAGLQAAVSAASDGMSVCVVAGGPAGGQIGETPRFENSILATGQTGAELTQVFIAACDRFGVEWVSGQAYSVSGWRGDFTVRWERPRLPGKMLPDDDTGKLRAKAVVLATGKSWRRLDVLGLARLVEDGRASYGPRLATTKDWDNHTDKVILYGGGPASGQAAVILAERGVSVTLLCRAGLSMPQYLIDRLDALDNTVTVRTGEALLSVTETDAGVMAFTDSAMFTGTHLMVCAGQEPNTRFLRGFVETGDDGRVTVRKGQTGTSVDGVYAVGDCRAGSAHRVPSAMGDGSMAIHELWRAGRVEDRPTCHPVPPQKEGETAWPIPA